MRAAFSLLGLLTLLVTVGGYVAFNITLSPSGQLMHEDTRMALTLTSPAFQHDGLIPSRYTCDGENISPELHISGVPDGTASLVILMDDPDIPVSVKQTRGIDTFDHWVLYNIEPGTGVIPEGVSGMGVGLNTRGTTGYTGPCPPDREHRYFFRVYALSGTLTFLKIPTLQEVEEAARSMMLETASLVGRYERARQ